MAKVREIADRVYQVFCPGCKETHTIHVNGKKNGSKATWSFDMNLEAPTFSPSINLRTGKYADPDWQEPDEPGIWSVICHSFIRNGIISFLNDCTHELKGQSVVLPDIQ